MNDLAFEGIRPFPGRQIAFLVIVVASADVEEVAGEALRCAFAFRFNGPERIFR